MTLKLYVDRMSQACREVIIFCKLNGIDFEEVHIDLSKRQQLSPEYREINPIRQIPAIMDGRFKLSESHAILKYLACAFPRIADHWYPADLYKRAKVESVLDWHRTNFPRGPGSYTFYSVLAPTVGLPLNTKAAARTEKMFIACLATIESVWLQKKGRFLLGSDQPSIADLSLACEIMQLEVKRLSLFFFSFLLLLYYLLIQSIIIYCFGHYLEQGWLNSELYQNVAFLSISLYKLPLKLNNNTHSNHPVYVVSFSRPVYVVSVSRSFASV